ncbi:unnamed protein product [Urochloa decumbens]|uniref:Uncharacterized protein n=1 Tax=Urochloa decumbens TaxID=240449 RepID=A0ABC9GK62_9POAL
MALPTRRAGVLLQFLVVVLALAAAFISCAAAARAPGILQEVEAAAAPDQGQAPAAGSDAMSVEHVAVVDKSGGFFGIGHHGHHHYSSGHHRHRHNSAPGGRDGAWKAAGLAATVAAGAWLL